MLPWGLARASQMKTSVRVLYRVWPYRHVLKRFLESTLEEVFCLFLNNQLRSDVESEC